MENDRHSFSTVSLVTQGAHKFYTLTMPSEILADNCYALNREEDNIIGFQRVLDKRRAQEIANYIDSGLGTIPSSIVLSAQDDADFIYDSKRKSISFLKVKNAFLIIDGQHRVYGFSLANTRLRVPVVIYDNLNKRDESRLFIDINSKQKGVPTELLLDIKRLAEYENNDETRMRIIFDKFKDDNQSIFFNKLSPSKKSTGKITRTVFNSSISPLVKLFENMDDDELYFTLSAYFNSIYDNLFKPSDLEKEFFVPTIFKAASGFFPIVAKNVKLRFGSEYTYDNFSLTLSNINNAIKKQKFKDAKNAYKPLVKHMEECLNAGFTL